MSTLIQTARLRLRALRDDTGDAGQMRVLLNDPQFHRFIGDRGVRTVEQARDYLRQGPLASYAEHGFGMYAIERLADGAWLGIGGLVRRKALPCADIGYALHQAYTGQGYALEAMRAVMTLSATRFALDQVCAIVEPDNARSIALLHKLGLQPQGGIVMPDATHTLLLFGARLAR